MTSSLVAHSDNGIIIAINQRLKQDGLPVDIDPQQKLTHLWHLLLQMENQTKNLEENLEAFQKQRNSEVSELENYVKHIHKISEDKESVILDFENENKELKSKLDSLSNYDFESVHQENINKLLIHQGLQDIININTVEQVAFLLVERNHLLKDLEEKEKILTKVQEKVNKNDDNSDNDAKLKHIHLQKILEEERTEFDKELQHQQIAMRDIKEQMNAIHEKEIHQLMKEKQELQKQLAETWKKILELTSELHELQQKVSPESTIEELPLLEELEEKQQEINILKQEKLMLNEKLQKLEVDYQYLKKQLSSGPLITDKKSVIFDSITSLEDDPKLESENDIQIDKLKILLSEAQEELKLQKEEFEKEEIIWKEKLSKLLEEIQNLSEELAVSKEECLKLKKLVEEHTSLDMWNRIDDLNKQTQDLQGELYKKQHEIDEIKNRPENKDEVIMELEERIKALNKCKHQLENENQELAYKLSQALIECEQTEELLRQEKGKTINFLISQEELMSHPNIELELLNKQLDHSQEELHARTTELNTLRNDMRTEQARSEVNISSLKLELERVKLDSMKACEALSDTLEKSHHENKNIQEKVNKKQEDLTITLSNLTSIQDQKRDLEIQLNKEKSLQTNLTDKIRSLEDEILVLKKEINFKDLSLETVASEKDKLNQDLKQKLEHLSDLEKKFNDLQNENIKLSNLFEEESQSQNVKFLKETNQMRTETKEEVTQVETKLIADLCYESEKKIPTFEDKHLKSINLQLEETLSQLTAAEQRAAHAERLRQDLQASRDETVHLRYQLQQEKLHRKLEQEQLQHLQQQFSETQNREKEALRLNSELQHSLLDIQSKLSSMHDQTKSLTDKQHVTELGKLTLVEQINHLLKETESLHLELIATQEKNELHSRRYEHLKIKQKIKMQRAKELFNAEKAHLREAIQQLEEFSFLQSKLTREIEWREKIEKEKKQLILEKRDLVSRLCDNEELLKEKKREINLITIRIQTLEAENRQLLEKNESLIKQVTYLHRTLKEQRMEHQRQILHQATESLLSQIPSSVHA